jgi:hypothetical protein
MAVDRDDDYVPEEHVSESDSDSGDENASEHDEDFIDGARDEVLAEADDDAYQSPDYSGKSIQDIRNMLLFNLNYK